MNFHDITLDDDFLSNQDRDHIADLIYNFLSEKGVDYGSFSYSIEITYSPEGGENEC